MEIDSLRDFIHGFSFDKCRGGNQGFNRILIQLFGFLGHGKSSFINTCIYVMEDGEYQNWAKADEDHGGSTKERIPHKLTEYMTLVDNRGLSKMDGYETGEIFAQLSNLLPLGKVQYEEGFPVIERITRAEKSMKTSDFIFPVFVHKVLKPIPQGEQDDMKKVLRTTLDLTGVWPIVVLTHKSSGHLTYTEEVFRNMGVERIYSFDNYTREDHMKTRGRHEEALKFLCEVIKDVQFKLEHESRDPVKEIMRRKKFVIQYIHEADKKAKQDKIERGKAMEQLKLKKEMEEQEKKINQQREKTKQEQEMKEKKLQEELKKQREKDLARQEEELRAEQEKQKKKGGFFKKLFK